MRRVLAAGLALLALGGCSGPQVLLLEGGPVLVGLPQGERLLVEAGQGVALLTGQPFNAGMPANTWAHRAALEAQPAEPRRFQLFYRRDGALEPRSELQMEQVLATLRERSPAVVWVIGHTDTLGDARFNEGVGLSRATRMAARLKGAGIEMLELRVASHGEANPLVRTPDETYEPRNRRVEIRIQ
ncbi:OmpA family protein [Stutzerimonas tarimensis]|uniref:OmpA family protein n=1 Tax=Stutzerimonas tarimensis TaxID=1507735 RepID=A0ABV7T7I6_9GAMM